MRLRRVMEWPGAVYELLRLGVVTRFRFGGEYWRWRKETAFGHAGDGGSRSRGELALAAWEYARWVWRTRGGM